MNEITLEKVEQIIERTGLSYAEAKEALEENNGDVLETLIYFEKKFEEEKKERFNFNLEEKYETIDEFKKWLSDIIKKGNISRIKIKKDEKVLVDVPVNAGIAAGVIAVILTPLLAVGVITAVATKITIEVTEEDGTVHVVNKIIKETANDVKEKTVGFAGTVKDKLNKIKNNSKVNENEDSKHAEDESVYSYTVNFDEIDKEEQK